MKNEKTKKIAAFPVAMSEQTFSNQDSSPFNEGMTLRDYFAAKAMQAIIPIVANSNPKENIKNLESHAAKMAYGMADAMLKQRDN